VNFAENAQLPVKSAQPVSEIGSFVSDFFFALRMVSVFRSTANKRPGILMWGVHSEDPETDCVWSPTILNPSINEQPL
jgi:hypothetical protein